MKATLLLLLLSSEAAAQSRLIAEGARSTKAVVYISTPTPRVHLATMAYSGATSNVSLYTTSNVVVGSGDAVVLYATGAIKIGGVSVTTFSASQILLATNTWGGQNNYTQASTFTGTMYTASSNTAAGGLFGFYRGTSTYVNVTNAPNNCCACATDSSTTFVSDSGTTTINLSGAMALGGSSPDVGWSILVDGLNPAGNGLACGGAFGTAGQQLMGREIGDSVINTNRNIGGSRRLTVAPGSHTFCLTMCSSDAGADSAASAPPLMEIAEAH